MRLASTNTSAALAIAAGLLAGAPALAHEQMPGMEEASMDHSQHQGMDHSGMDHSGMDQGDGADHSAHLAGGGLNGKETHTRIVLHDELLLTHEGEPVKFVSEALDDKLVAITVAYTSCTTVCPVTSVIFKQVQDALGSRMENEVRLVSVTVDPVNDTPPRLAKYARRHGVGQGWMWLTGEKSHVDQVLTGLGAYTPEFEDHPIMFLVGDPKRDTWTRLFGFPDPAKIVAEIDQLAAERSSAAAQ